jgi:hypothetical protein
VIVLVPVVVTAAAARTVFMMMLMVVVTMLVVMRLIMPMVMMLMAVRMSVAVAMALTMAVAVTVMMVVMLMIVVADMGAALRLEGPLDGSCRTALPAHEFGDGRIVLDVEGVCRDFDQAMAAAEMPGETREAQGVLGLDLQQRLGRSLDLDELAVLEPQGIAVVDGGFHVEIEMDLGAALSLQRTMATVSRRVVEGDGVDDAAGLHGGLADDGGDAGHGFVSVCDRVMLR